METLKSVKLFIANRLIIINKNLNYFFAEDSFIVRYDDNQNSFFFFFLRKNNLRIRGKQRNRKRKIEN